MFSLFIRLTLAISAFANFCVDAQAQDSVSFRINIRDMDREKLVLHFDDGLVSDVIHLATDSVTEFRKRIYTPFSTVSVDHTNGSYHQVFIIEENDAELNFYGDISKETNPMLADNHHGVIPLFDTLSNGIFRDLHRYERNERENLGSFINKHGFGNQKDEELQSELTSLVKSRNQKNMEFLTMHAEEFFSFYWFKSQVLSSLNFIQNDPEYISDLITYYNTTFPAAFRHTPEGENVALQLQQKLSPVSLAEGMLFPDIHFQDFDGSTIGLTEQEQPFVLIDFWASWCGPCIQQLPDLQFLRDKFSEDHLKMVSISIDRDSTEYINAVKEHDIRWINSLDRGGIKSATLGVESIPRVVILDRKGMIVYYKKGGRIDLERVQDILNQSI